MKQAKHRKPATQAVDLVCGMAVDIHKDAFQSVYHGTTCYFCASSCQRQFETDPELYLRSAAVPAESAEPPFTNFHGFVAPKFGSAGSGGAEYEPGPR